jgi:cobalt-zinc-cadmium efflux system outer membrane protein
MGPSPGAGASSFLTIGGNESLLGGGDSLLGGGAAILGPKVPSSILQTGPQVTAPPSQGITAPAALPVSNVPLFGTLEQPGDPEDLGPADGLTIQMAIERLVRENLDLRSKAYEIPQADADVLTASLRANPIFYADAQLIPYGQYTVQRPGGQRQYDINISHPLDLSRKRPARVNVAIRARKVLEAQYQDAVRMQIANLHTAYVDVLAARETVRYAETSVKGLTRIQEITQTLQQKGENKTRADVDRVLIQVQGAEIGVLDAREQYSRAKRTLATLLNYPPDQVDNFEIRGTIRDEVPPPPPVDELIKIALQFRPDLNSYRLGVERARADVNLARRNAYQDAYLLVQPYTLQDNSPVGLKSATSYAVGLTLPVPVYNRNQGNIQRARLNITQTQIETLNLERQIINEVRAAESEYRVSRLAVERVESQLLPTARDLRDSLEQLFKGGEENLVVLLNGQREYNDAVKAFRDTAVRHRRSMLGVNTAIGQRILP